jgi:hypothetical protein
MAPVVKKMTSETWNKIGNTTWSDGGFMVGGTIEWLYVERGEWKSSPRPPQKAPMDSDDYPQIKGGTLNVRLNYIDKGGTKYQVAWDEDPPGGGPPKSVVRVYDG